MEKFKLCYCGKPSVLGLKQHIALCKYHHARYVWGSPNAKIYEPTPKKANSPTVNWLKLDRD